MGKMVDARELSKRVVKYLLEGLMVAFAALVLPRKSMNVEEVVGLALVAAATFAVLDMYAPNGNGRGDIAAGARTGAGFGLGANLVGFPR